MAPLLPFSLIQSCTSIRIHLLSDICYRLVCAGHLQPINIYNQVHAVNIIVIYA